MLILCVPIAPNCHFSYAPVIWEMASLTVLNFTSKILRPRILTLKIPIRLIICVQSVQMVVLTRPCETDIHIHQARRKLIYRPPRPNSGHMEKPEWEAYVERAGSVPGTVAYTGEYKDRSVEITILDYDETQFQEKRTSNVEECFPFKDEPTITWINVDGIHDTEIIEKIGKHFDLHPLVQEDIVNSQQRAKLETFEDYMLIIFRMIYSRGDSDIIHGEQISLLLGDRWVISFQEEPQDIFENIRDRIRRGKGRIRREGADYLAYALLDTVIDNYFFILEEVGDRIETIEEELVTDPPPEVLQTIYRLKREVILLRKTIWPLREVVSGLQREESRLIHKRTTVYMRDAYDHTIQVIDAIETYRDLISGMLDIHLTTVSNRMNEVMKVLTIVATIFIPLTFIAGVYGMNFVSMPELGWEFGYPMVWIVMLIIGVLMVVYFIRKNWM